MTRLFASIRRWMCRRRAGKVSLAGARKRVQRGATYLDDVAPGWYRNVDAATLELAEGGSCVLGQLHGDFRVGLVRARLLSASSAPRANLSPVAFGFQCVSGVAPAVQDADYDHLTAAWKAAVRQRFASEDLSSDARRPSPRKRPRRAPVARSASATPERIPADRP